MVIVQWPGYNFVLIFRHFEKNRTILDSVSCTSSPNMCDSKEPMILLDIWSLTFFFTWAVLERSKAIIVLRVKKRLHICIRAQLRQFAYSNLKALKSLWMCSELISYYVLKNRSRRGDSVTNTKNGICRKDNNGKEMTHDWKLERSCNNFKYPFFELHNLLSSEKAWNSITTENLNIHFSKISGQEEPSWMI